MAFIMCYNTQGTEMSKVVKQNKPARVKEGEGLKSSFVPVLTLLLVIAIIIGALCFYRNYPDRVEELKAYGYLGAFLISLILNATVILPAGNFLIIAALGAALPSATLGGLAGGGQGQLSAR